MNDPKTLRKIRKDAEMRLASLKEELAIAESRGNAGWQKLVREAIANTEETLSLLTESGN